MTESTYSSDSGSLFGKLAFFVGFAVSALNIGETLTSDLPQIEISFMDIISAIIIVLSAIFGIPYAYYKLKNEHYDYVVRKEKRKKTGAKPIRFRMNFWKSWGKKK